MLKSIRRWLRWLFGKQYYIEPADFLTRPLHTISIVLSGNVPVIDAFGFVLVYDPTVMKFKELETANTLTQNWKIIAAQENVEGMVIVGGFQPSSYGYPVTKEGILLDLTFTFLKPKFTTTLAIVNLVDDIEDAIAKRKTITS